MEKHMNKVQQKNKFSLFTHAHTSDSQSLVGGVSTWSVQSEVAAQLTVWGCLCGCFINAFCACVSQVWQAEEYGCSLVLTGVCVCECVFGLNEAVNEPSRERHRCPRGGERALSSCRGAETLATIRWDLLKYILSIYKTNIYSTLTEHCWIWCRHTYDSVCVCFEALLENLIYPDENYTWYCSRKSAVTSCITTVLQ